MNTTTDYKFGKHKAFTLGEEGEGRGRGGGGEGEGRGLLLGNSARESYNGVAS